MYYISVACNYDPIATLYDVACKFPYADGNCGEVVEGCVYSTALNYDASATEDSGNCVFTGCADSEAFNFNLLASLEDSSCTYQVCPDFNGDGSVQAQDLLDFLIAWGTFYE